MQRLAQNLVLFLASLLVVLLLAEGALRLKGYGSLVLYDPHPTRLWVLRPSQVARDKVSLLPIAIDSLGLRSREISRAKGPRTFRILIVGDSVTFGFGVGQEEAFTEVLERILADSLPGWRVEVLNAGVNGYALWQETDYLREEGLALRPDCVIAAYSYNEWWAGADVLSSPEARARVVRLVRLKNFLRRSALYNFVGEIRLRKYYYRYRTRFTSREPRSLPEGKRLDVKYALYRERLEELRDVVRGAPVPVVFLVLPSRQLVEEETADRYGGLREVMREFARSEGIPVVDGGLKAFRAQGLDASGRSPCFLEGDDLHPSPLGHRLLAIEIFRVLRGAALLPSGPPAEY